MSQLNSDLGTCRFGITEDGRYGYIVTGEDGADTVIPFSFNLKKVCGDNASISENIQSYTFTEYCPLCIGLAVDFVAAPRDSSQQGAQYQINGEYDGIDVLDEGVYNYGQSYSIAYRIVVVRGVQAGSVFRIGYEWGTHLTYAGIYIAN